MINDSFTMAGIAVVILIALLVVGIMIYSHMTTKNDMRLLAQRTILLSTDEEIRNLCKKIMDIDPKSCPLMDKDVHREVTNQPERLKDILEKHLAKLQG